MDVEQLVRQYPQLYHMSEAGSWPSIMNHGLLSTTALLDLFEKKGPEREQIESNLRRRSVTIRHHILGDAVIRDQGALCNKPGRRTFLKDCLEGVSVEEWCKFLNGKVFFWVDTVRLIWMLTSPVYSDRPHWVITVDTQSLIALHDDQVSLSHLNSGSIYKGELRGPNTFKSIDDYNERFIAELAVEYSVPNVVDITIAVEEYKGDQKLRDIWPE